jgi:hypothetical protein
MKRYKVTKNDGIRDLTIGSIPSNFSIGSEIYECSEEGETRLGYVSENIFFIFLFDVLRHNFNRYKDDFISKESPKTESAYNLFCSLEEKLADYKYDFSELVRNEEQVFWFYKDDYYTYFETAYRDPRKQLMSRLFGITLDCYRGDKIYDYDKSNNLFSFKGVCISISARLAYMDIDIDNSDSEYERQGRFLIDFLKTKESLFLL